MNTEVSVALAATIVTRDLGGKEVLRTQKNVSFTGAPAVAYDAAAAELSKWKAEVGA